MRFNKYKLDVAMAERGFSVQRLARESGAAPSTVSLYRNGKPCKPDVANKIAEALNVPVRDLVEDETEARL